MTSTIQDLRTAWPLHKDAARQAFNLFDSYCVDGYRRRVPGMGTTERLCLRIFYGKSIEQAAAAEYLYRWTLAIKAPDQCNATGQKSYEPRDRQPRACVSIFGAPHLLGM